MKSLERESKSTSNGMQRSNGAFRRLVCTTGLSVLRDQAIEIPPLPTDRWLDENAVRIAETLLDEERFSNRLGAEIVNARKLIDKGWLLDPPDAVHLCVSDTPEGTLAARVIEHVLDAEGWNVSLSVVPELGLAAGVTEAAAARGLRNLASTVARAILEGGTPANVAVDVTGGFKGQTAIATVAAQMLGATVLYRYEEAKHLVRIPTLPVTLDLSIFDRWADDLEALDGAVVPGRCSDFDPEMVPLLEETQFDDGTWIVGLNVIGAILLEKLRTTRKGEPDLPPDAAPRDRKRPRRVDDHVPEGFWDLLDKVWTETSYVTTIQSTSYDRQRGIAPLRFQIDNRGNLKLDYKPNGFGARAIIFTTARNDDEKRAALADLRQRYGERKS